MISPDAHSRLQEFAKAVEYSPAEVFTVNADRLVTSHNRSSSERYGYTVPDIVGHTAEQVLPDDETRAGRLEFVSRALAGEQIPAFEQRRLNARGETAWVEIYGGPIADDQDVIVGMFGSARDITEVVNNRRRVDELQQLLEVTQAAAHVGSWVVHIDEGVVEMSPEHCRLYGLDPEVRRYPFEVMLGLMHPEERAARMRVLDIRDKFTTTFRVLLHSGEVRTFWTHGTYEPSQHRGSGRVLGVTRDITDEHAERIAREEAESELRLWFDAAMIGVALADRTGRVWRINRAMCEMLGRPETELAGITFEQLLQPEDREAGMEAMRLMASGEREKDRQTIRYGHPDGYTMWVEMSVSRVTGADGKTRHFVVQAQDVTQRLEYEGRLLYMVDHDPVTGLLNRRGFDHHLRRHLEARDGDSPDAVLLVLDIDRYSRVNNTLGQMAGDHVAKEIGAALSAMLSAPHVLGRLGGGAFAALLSGVDQIQAELISVQISQEIADAVLRAGIRTEKPVTISIGIAFPRAGAGNPTDELMAHADAAMHTAKSKGGDCYVVYSDS